MSTPPKKGALAQLHLDRSAIARQTQIALAVLAERENTLKAALLDAIPKGLRFWLVEDMIMTNLFEHGQASRWISFGDLERHRLGDKETFLRYINRLAEVWDEVVTIVQHADADRLQISFKVAL